MSNIKNILVIDFETSGLPESGGRPVECAAILADLKTHQEIDHIQFYMCLEPDEIMDPDAQKTHGLSKEWLLQNGISRSTGSYMLMEWLFSYGIITSNKNMRGNERGQLMAMGQNVGFDLLFMRQLIGSERMKVFTHRTKDPMPIASYINDVMIQVGGLDAAPFVDNMSGYPSSSLVAQMEYYGYDPTHAHGALYDARMCLAVYKHHVDKLKQLILKVSN